MSAIAAVEVVVNITDQIGHRATTIVAGDVRVQVLPDTFNLVVVGAVGWQEVQHEALSDGSLQTRLN